MTLTYTTSAGKQGPMPGETLIFSWVKTPQGGLNLSAPFFGGLQQSYTPLSATPIDGDWTWLMNGTTTSVSMHGGVFFSMAFNPNEPPTTTIGTYTAANNQINIYYAYAPDVLLGSVANGTYQIGKRLNLQIYIPAIREQVTLSNGIRADVSSFWEGTWKGSTIWNDTTFCITSAQFSGNTWEGHQSDCTPGSGLSFGSFSGTFLGSTSSIALTYGFVDMNGEPGGGPLGMTITFSVAVSFVGSLTQVVLTSMNAPTTQLVQIA